MSLPRCNLPPIDKFKGLSSLPILGLGTIWLGRRWPADNKNYIAPSKKETELFLLSAYTAGVQMIDTAVAYGYSEEIIGTFLKSHPDIFKKVFIATKWGENFDVTTEESSTDHSVENLINSFKRSGKFLSRIDLLYIHKADANVLSNKAIQNKMNVLLKTGRIKYTGASVSNADVLRTCLDRDCLWVDFIQTSADVAFGCPNLIEAIFNSGVAVVLNSPIRKKSKILSPKDSYLNLANNPNVSFILTGTRTHFDEVIGYFS